MPRRSKSRARHHSWSRALVLRPGRDRGARFIVELATAPAEEQPSSPCAAASSPAGVSGTARRYNILLVEDHADTAEALTVFLENEGYRVAVAASIARALAVDLTSVDVMISDLGLPDGSGLDLMRQLGEGAPPAIAFSGYGMPEDLASSKRAGFYLHLTKPLDFQQLRSALRELLERNADASATGA